jgi:hypothetical protein
MKVEIFASKKLANGRKEWFPEFDPLSSSGADPTKWYEALYKVFAWLPEKQFKDKMGDHVKQNCKCVHCGGINFESHEYDYRPMHVFGTKIQCLHRRLRC